MQIITFISLDLHKFQYLRTILRTISHYNHLDLLDKKASADRQSIDFIDSQTLPRKMIT